jgi:glycosyltransferase involved in cell wall biosynthesis
MTSVSVVIPTYNRAGLIGRAVRSAIASCRPGEEIIVVDDGSSDGTAAAMEPFADRVRYVPLPRGGAGRTRNRGVALARHPLVAFLDSDDEWMPGYLETKRRLMEARPDLVFCFSDFAGRAETGEIDRMALRFWPLVPEDWKAFCAHGVRLSSLIELPPGTEDTMVHTGDLYRQEMAANYVLTSTLLARKDRTGSEFRFAENVPTYEDWECFGRLARCGPGAYLSCETAWQCRHPGPRLTDAGPLKTTEARIVVLQNVWGADPEYLALHAADYARVLQQQRRIRIRALLRAGRTVEARELLGHIGDAPLGWRVLAYMPAGLSKTMVRGRTALRKMLRAA